MRRNFDKTKKQQRNKFREDFSFFMAILHGMWDLSSLTRDGTWAPCGGNAGSLPLDCKRIPSDLFLSRGNIQIKS